MWQISVQNRQLFFFFFSQFSPASFFKTFDRILALLRLLANDLNGFGVTEFGLRAGFCDRSVFQRRFKHTQHAQFRSVFGAHRLLQIRVHTLLQCHAAQLRRPNAIVDFVAVALWATILGTLNCALHGKGVTALRSICEQIQRRRWR